MGMDELVRSLGTTERLKAMWFVFGRNCDCLGCCRWRHVMHRAM